MKKTKQVNNRDPTTFTCKYHSFIHLLLDIDDLEKYLKLLVV